MLIDENKLDSWVRDNAEKAQGVIVELVLKLVSASSPGPKERRFPRRDSIGQHGHDGVLVTDFPFPPFVPNGRSIWAIGTGLKAAKKATSDYSESTRQERAEDRVESTFVFVTPLSARRGWKQGAQTTWCRRRRKKEEWKDVQVIDGTILIDWLEKFPSVMLWLAQEMGLPAQAIESLQQHWDIVTTIGAPPPLPAALFLANRDAASAKVRDVFAWTTPQLRIDTHFTDQVVPFVSALVAAMDEEQRLDAFGRSLIVKSPEAWKAVMELPRHVLLADFDIEPETASDLLLERAKRAGHGVIYRGPPGGLPHPNRVGVPAPSVSQTKEALQKCGYAEERARALAQKSGGNLTSLLRLLQNLSLMPEWAENTQASHLAIAELLGSWNEGSTADRAIVEGVAGKAYGEWIAEMREVVTRAGTPLIHSSGIWKMIARYEAWYALGPKLFDEHLDRFAVAVESVLRERDPKFDLPPHERFAANIRGKALRYSSSLRNGLAESLALLGSHPRALKSCSPDKALATAVLSVRAILKSADWITWASLNDVSPLLAEAAPEEFMNAVEATLNDEARPFTETFAQEGDGITGWNYMSGILWGLETVAWDPDQLTRATTLLAEMATQDPGGKWSNRPSNSLTTIFLPWFPQTVASPEKRRLAVEAIVEEAPNVGWKLLLSLLPEQHTTSMGTRKPTWRATIPEDWTGVVTRGEYWKQVGVYAEVATELAQKDLNRLSQLVERLDDLPPPAAEAVIGHLRSETLKSAPAEDRLKVWTSLTELVSTHRKFRDAQWAMPEDRLQLIDDLANDLVPQDPLLRNRRLFSERDFELYDQKGNWEEQARRLDKRRDDAVLEVYSQRGVDGVLAFAASVESPWRVGVACGALTDLIVDHTVLPGLLITEAKALAQFVGGLVLGRFRLGGWSWADRTLETTWTPEQSGQFLAYLPFVQDAWTRAARVLGTDAGAYWARTPANPYQAEAGLPEAIEELLRYERPLAAVRCLARLIHDNQAIRTDQAIRALVAAATTKEPTGGIHAFEIAQLIKKLQDDPETDVEGLCKVEWMYLQMMDGHKDVWPKTLERRLADQPAFFCELIGILYRSKHEDKPKEDPSEAQKFAARQSFHLLHAWKTPPGTRTDGTFDGTALAAWLKEVKSKCKASGHLEVAMITLGHVLSHSPADPSGLWIHRAAAAVLNTKDAEDIRTGFRTELYNQRGVHWVDPSGNEERKLAEEYRQKADAVERAGYPRVATSVRELASSYDWEAERVTKEALNE